MPPENETTPPWLEGVEGGAVEIAASDAPLLRVSAGPGTGKTFALMRRVWRLLYEGVDPSRVLVVTFTRTAARDLVDHLRELGVEGADQVQAGTLHSYCFRVLGREGVLELTGRHPRPLLKHEVRVLQEDLKREGDWGIRESRELLNAFEAAWARLHHDEPGWPQSDEEEAFGKELVQWLRFHQAMLIGELVPRLRDYLRNNPGAEELGAFDHVLVDEYQDLNRADQDLIDRLAHDATLTIIGDEDQAIYSLLRYAQPESIRLFHEDHPGTQDAPLTECRRCPRTVVNIANHLIRHNENRAERELEPRAENPDGEAHILQWDTLAQEASGLANLIGDALENRDLGPGNILVLTPRRISGYAIRDHLHALGVDAHSYFSEEALDSEQAKEGFTLLNLLARPRDRAALRTWLSFDHGSYGAAPYSYLRRHCEDSEEHPRDALQRIVAGDLSIPYSQHLLQRFEVLLEREEDLAGAVGQDLVDALFPEEEEGISAIRELASDVLEASESAVGAEELLEGLRIRIIQPELPEAGDYVRIMSLHKSKGLTAEMVIVAGCIEGWIPTLTRGEDGTESLPEIEEQRRLFYVALTRGRQVLILSSFRSLPAQDAYRMRVRIGRLLPGRVITVASRFLGELGPEAPEPVGVSPGVTLPDLD